MLNAVSKILEKVASSRILAHLEENNLLSTSQYAYRKGKGTDLALTKFVNDVIRNYDDNKFTLSVFIDLTKAFDCISHEKLAVKLRHYGITNIAHDWITNYLTNQ